MNINQPNIDHIQKIIHQISQQEIRQISQQEIQNITTNSSKVDKLFQIIECLMWEKPVNISNYSINLVSITTKEICIKCKRQAVYTNLLQKEGKYCWIHSQNLNR